MVSRHQGKLKQSLNNKKTGSTRKENGLDPKVKPVSTLPGSAVAESGISSV